MSDKNQLYVVMGLGKTGLSCVRYLVNKGYSVAVTDDRAIPPGLHELKTTFPQVPVYAGYFSEAILSQADVLVISPGVSIFHPMVQAQKKRGVSILGDIELFALEAKAPIIAITGTNGKSTVTTLVGKMAEDVGLM
jgi:UDP-N-acetylmuramoylalanine--D-glutamate ligase